MKLYAIRNTKTDALLSVNGAVHSAGEKDGWNTGRMYFNFEPGLYVDSDSDRKTVFVSNDLAFVQELLRYGSSVDFKHVTRMEESFSNDSYEIVDVRTMEVVPLDDAS